MKVSVLFHPNQGQRLPKVWLCHKPTNRVAHGTIGSALSLRTVKANVRNTFSQKRSSGYWDLGEISMNDDSDLLALTKSLLEIHRCDAQGAVVVKSHFQDVVLTLRRWAQYKCRVHFDHFDEEVSIAPSVVSAPLDFQGPIVNDTSDSWF